VLVVSGHLDSRNTDIMDSTGKAPGANDDASGVAIVMEMARIMAKREFPCTVIFVAVQGEEQGLLGAKHLAGRAKTEGWNLIAMATNDIVGNSFSNETNLHDNTTVRVFSEGCPPPKRPKWQRPAAASLPRTTAGPGNWPATTRRLGSGTWTSSPCNWSTGPTASCAAATTRPSARRALRRSA
jgi:hypothetical protein